MSLFPEEQLDSPLGYFPARPGQTLKNGTWTISRKLGWGPRSSTWLIIDKNDQHRAIKILTVAATADPNANNERHFVLEAMKAIPSGVPELLETFVEKDERGRKHLCLLFRLLGPSVEDLRQGNVYDGQNLSIHIVKKVIGDISDRLANLATKNIIHGGKSNCLFRKHLSWIYILVSAVTPDNFLFFSVQRGVDVRKALAKAPADKPVKIQGSDGVWYPTVKSQPIPNHYTWESKADDIAYTTFSLANFAHGNACLFPWFHELIVNSSSLARQTTATTLDTPKNVQPPEALTGGKIDLKSDVWTLGCTVSLILILTPFSFSEHTLIDDP